MTNTGKLVAVSKMGGIATLSIEILLPGLRVGVHVTEALGETRRGSEEHSIPLADSMSPSDHSVPWNQAINYGVFMDPRDGRRYRTVKIGKQVWMAENLAFNVPGSWVYGNDPANEPKYGRLYSWETAIKSIPPGWHLPTDKEWMELEMAVGMGATMVKEVGWRGTNREGFLLRSSSNWAINGGNDQTGFRALPGGFRDLEGVFSGNQAYANFWSSSCGRTGSAIVRYFRHLDGMVGRYEFGILWGQSVRCVRDAEL